MKKGDVNRLLPRLGFLAAVFGIGCSMPDKPGAQGANESDHAASVRQAVVQNMQAGFSLPAGVDFHQVATGATAALSVGDRVKLLSSTGFAESANAGASPVQYGYDAQVGSITSIGPVGLLDRVRVTGSIRSAATVTLGTNDVITGTISSNVGLGVSRYEWSIPFNTSVNNITVNAGTTTLAAGSYGSVALNGGTLVLGAGTYYIDQLALQANTTLTINNNASPTFLYVRSSLAFRTNMTGAPQNLLLGYLGTQATAIETPFKGTIVAPNASVRLAVGNTPHTGSVFAKTVVVDPGVELTLRTFSRWDMLGLEVVPRFECVQVRPDGSKAVVFGYTNQTANPVTIPVGDLNKFSSGVADRYQPRTFLPGVQNAAFAINYTGNTPPAWILNGLTAAVNTATTCASPTYSATKDASLRLLQPMANFGAASDLRVGPGEHAVIGLNRAQIKTQLGVARLVASAKLQLTLATGAGTNLEVLPMRVDWTESGATWNCAADLNASASAERCQEYRKWHLVRRDGTEDNPWFKPRAVPVVGTVNGTTVTFDVSKEVRRLLGNESRGVPMSFIVLSKGTNASTFRSREAGALVAPRLVIETVPTTDAEATASPPLSFSVDPTLPVRPGETPPIPGTASGDARPRSAMAGPDGRPAEFTERELLVQTDDASELNAIKSRWNATETSTQPVPIPGVPLTHVLTVDLSRANPDTLVPNLQRMDNLPRGPHTVSSENGLRLLAIAAEEAVRGTRVGINVVGASAALSVEKMANNSFVEGLSTDGTSSNAVDWDYFKFYGVTNAWKELISARMVRRTTNVAIIDRGFDTNYFDFESYTHSCPGGSCGNIFEPSKMWHGLHVSNAGFGAPANQRGAAGPGGPVSNVLLVYGSGDLISIIYEIPALMFTEHIINLSFSGWLPAILTFNLWPQDAVTLVARETSNTLIFASAGNGEPPAVPAVNVDKEDCLPWPLDWVCWEAIWVYPCENHGVACVGATPGHGASPGRETDRAPISNWGAEDVDFWGAGSVMAPGDPDHQIDLGGEAKGTRMSSLPAATSFASPFVAGIAALTFTAGNAVSVGDAESCLSSTATTVDGRPVVNAERAVRCALGPSAGGFSPVVEIQGPLDGANIGGLGLHTASAIAADYEDGKLNTINWSLNGVPIGPSIYGGSFTFQISTPGLVKLRASATDSAGHVGSHEITLTVVPAPPDVRITSPRQDGLPFIVGLPVQFHAVRLGSLASSNCGGFVWDGFHSSTATPLFTNRVGCTIDQSFLSIGTGTVNARATDAGLTGTATRSVSLVQDSSLHTRIVSPLRSDVIVNDELGAAVDATGPTTVRAASVGGTGVLRYDWEIRSTMGLAPTRYLNAGPDLTFSSPVVPSGCAAVLGKILVTVTDVDGKNASDELPVRFHGVCIPP